LLGCTASAQITKKQVKAASTMPGKYNDNIDDRMKGPNGEKVYIGANGGRYYLTAAGNKVYVKHHTRKKKAAN
jgi:hypothetical protein